jgi:hypothetical protein
MRFRLFGFLLLAILLTIPLHAGTIAVNFIAPELYGMQGDTLTFGGTLVNSGTPDWINGADFNIDTFGPLDYSLDDFFNNTLPLPALNDGATAGPFAFFTVTIPLGFADGEYGGTLTVKGGSDMSADDTLGVGSFTVGVGVQAIPEPGSFLLLGILLVGLGITHSHRRPKV